MIHLKAYKLYLFLSVFFILLGVDGRPGWSAESSFLRQGIDDYNQENYEEALVSLQNAVKSQPSSSQAAYYAGLTSKEMLDYASAKAYFNKTLSLDSSRTEVYVPLAEVLYSLGEKDKSEKYLKAAKSKGIKSARASYLMGLILLDKGKKDDASREFRQAMTMEPSSEAALMSGEALDAMGVRESQLALALGYAFQYDDNVILKPSGSVIAVSDEDDTRHVITAGGDYSTNWGETGFRAGYSFYQSLHQDLDYMDVQAHSLFLMPSFALDKGSLYILGGYDYYLIDDDEYEKAITLKPSWSFTTEGGTGVNLFAGAIFKDYLNTPASKDEERDGTNINAGVGLLFPFNADRSYVKAGYTFDSEDTDGDNWDYSGHRAAISLSHPLAQALDLSLGGSYYQQNYKNTHSSFGKKRKDNIASLEAGLTYSYKGFDFNLSYSYTSSDSNIAVYDYSRNIAGIGATYTF